MGYTGPMFGDKEMEAVMAGDLGEAWKQHRIAQVQASEHDYHRETHLEGERVDDGIIREYRGELYDLQHGKVGGF